MRSYKKPYRIKQRKPIWKNRFFGLAILIFAVMGGISYFLFFSGFFKIENIAIAGTQKIPHESIKWLIPEGNVFLIDTEKIEEDILGNFPQIAVAKISKSLPDALYISIIERLPAALWCELEMCSLIDKEGVIFQRTENETGLIKISGQKEALDQKKVAQILDIKDKLSDTIGVTTTEAIIVSAERLNIIISEGWEIYFNLEGNLNWQMQELDLVLEKQITPEKRKKLEYIDLRFSRVFYK